MGAVGKLDQHDTHILGHGQQHLAQVFGLDMLLECGFALLLEGLDDIHFGHTVDQRGHAGAKSCNDVIERDIGIFDHIMQQGGHDGLAVHFHVGKDQCHRNGMMHIGFT